jgi:hypothetical protein
VSSRPITVAVATFVGRLVASPIAAVAALTVLTGVGGFTGAATMIAAATGCARLAAALAAAVVASVAAVLLSLLPLLSSLLLDDPFVGVAGPADGIWLGSAGVGTPLVAAGFACESTLPGTPAALPFAAVSLGVWGPVLPPVEALAGVFPMVTSGGLGAPTCGVAVAGLLPPGVVAGFELALELDGWEVPWPCAGAPPAFFGAGFAAPLVGAGFAGAELVDAELVGPGFGGAEFAAA